MNVDNTSNHRQHTVGLSPLNKTAFSRMLACGHRVVSIDKLTNSNFLVNTECTSGIKSGRDSCKGYMHFYIKHKEVKLYLARFEHTDNCTYFAPKRGMSVFEQDTVTNTEPNSTSLRAIIDDAKGIANSDVKKEEDELSQSREAGYAQKTNFGLMRVYKILRSVEELESLIALNETPSSD